MRLIMPELPEVETVVRGLEPVLAGQRLKAVHLKRPDLRRPMPADLPRRLKGARIIGLERRAKYGLIHTDRGDTVIFHLGMSGRMRIDPPHLGPHDHVIFETDHGHVVSLQDPRRFGSVDLCRTADLAQATGLAGLGPEPLDRHFNAKALEMALAKRSGPIKTVLLDQRVVAGLGNIYVCEALFESHIHPERPAESLKAAEIALLVRAIKAVLKKAIKAGGSSLRDHRQPDGQLGYFQHQFRVYGRGGAPCPGCGGLIRRMVQAGRSSFYCPKCQH